MGVPTSEVGYTSAMPRREDHEVHKDMWGALDQKTKIYIKFVLLKFRDNWLTLNHSFKVSKTM